MAVFVAEGLTVALAGGWGLVAVRVGVARVGTGALVEAAGGLLVGVPAAWLAAPGACAQPPTSRVRATPAVSAAGRAGAVMGHHRARRGVQAKSGGDITRMPDGHSSAQGRATVAVSFLGRGAGAGTCAAGTSAV